MKESYQIMWDNGATASGVFDEKYDTLEEVISAGENWVAEMEGIDPSPTGEERYSFEVINQDNEIVY